MAVVFVCTLPADSDLRAPQHAHATQLVEEADMPWQYLAYDHGVVIQDFYNHRYPLLRWLSQQ